jgi:hypothetical protein
MTKASSIPDLKGEVRDFWNSEPCGSRYLEGAADFDAHARARYALEPHIQEFAQFNGARGCWKSASAWEPISCNG